MKKKLLVFHLLFLLLFSSCVTTKDTNLLQDIKKNYPVVNTPEDYEIIPGDQLRLAIYTLDENIKTLFPMYVTNQAINSGQGGSGQEGIGSMGGSILNVYSDGTVKIPYLGKIPVEKKTILEAKTIIAAQFSKYSANVNVDVVLNNKSFYVLGELGYRRVQMDKQRLNIFQALSIVNSSTDVGDHKKVYIIRQLPGGATQYKDFDLRSKDIVDSEYFYIQPNDVIYMPRVGRTFFGKISSFDEIFSTIATTTGMVITILGIKKLFE